MGELLGMLFGDQPWFIAAVLGCLAVIGTIVLLDRPAVLGPALVVALALLAALLLVVVWRRLRRARPG